MERRTPVNTLRSRSEIRIEIGKIFNFPIALSGLDCPRSGPGPVRALFADPGP